MRERRKGKGEGKEGGVAGGMEGEKGRRKHKE